MRASRGGKKVETQVTVENEQNKVPTDKNWKSLIERTVLECIGHAGIKDACEINVMLVDDEQICRLNDEHRKINKPTDVLSFPMLEMAEGSVLYGESDLDMDTGLLLLGDIVISLETAVRQAQEYGHPFERELAFLVSHGVFHLLGFDHMNEEESGRMFGNQEEVLGKMGLQRK